MNDIRILIVGAGTMGKDIAEFFLTNDVSVFLVEKNEDTMKNARKILESKGFSEPKLQVSDEIPNKLDINLAIESVSEDLTIKKEVIKAIESNTSDKTVIASNTSGLSISEISKDLAKPAQVVGMHFYTPATLIPLVEVIKSDFTSDKTCKLVYDFLLNVNKKPVILDKEIPGFIGNRIQHAIMREAIYILEKEVASISEIDEIIKWSVGIRLAMNGPFEQRDINGIDTHKNIADYLYETLSRTKKPSTILESKVSQKHLGIKTEKGFYDWSKEDIDKYYNEKNEILVNIIKLLK